MPAFLLQVTILADVLGVAVLKLELRDLERKQSVRGIVIQWQRILIQLITDKEKKKMKKGMTLFEIAEIVGVPVVDLSAETVEQAAAKGLITNEQKEHLRAELKRSDDMRIMPIGRIRRADQL